MAMKRYKPEQVVTLLRQIEVEIANDMLANALTEHYERTGHKELEDFVFCSMDGSPLNPEVLRKDVLYPILDRLGIPRSSGASGFHTFRHSAANILNERTANLKLAQRLLGHSTVNMTANTYTHPSAESEREATLAIERAVCGDLLPVVPASSMGRCNTF
jgi:integrase